MQRISPILKRTASSRANPNDLFTFPVHISEVIQRFLIRFSACTWINAHFTALFVHANYILIEIFLFASFFLFSVVKITDAEPVAVVSSFCRRCAIGRGRDFLVNRFHGWILHEVLPPGVCYSLMQILRCLNPMFQKCSVSDG